MTDYRFILEKYHGRESRHTCPNCHKKRCFTRYIDKWGLFSFPDDVGKCDHINSCGFHRSPKDFFKENRSLNETIMNQKKPFISENKINTSVSFHPISLMESTLKNYGQNHLFTFLSEKFGKKRTEELFTRYYVGTAKDNSTVFWLVDFLNRVRGGKIILYGVDGHRIKGTLHDVRWAHSQMQIPYFNFKSCYFGEHLLNGDRNSTIAMVESEKSAIIAACYIPECVWIATGGLGNGFSAEQLSLLRGRNVVLFPDLNGTEKWRSQLKKMKAMGIHATIFDGLEQLATKEEKQKGLDIADFLLNERPQASFLRIMMAKNPCIKTLIDSLDLELIS